MINYCASTILCQTLPVIGSLLITLMRYPMTCLYIKTSLLPRGELPNMPETRRSTAAGSESRPPVTGNCSYCTGGPAGTVPLDPCAAAAGFPTRFKFRVRLAARRRPSHTGTRLGLVADSRSSCPGAPRPGRVARLGHGTILSSESAAAPGLAAEGQPCA